jgi:D-lactate dehydrogenase (cytochrome)
MVGHLGDGNFHVILPFDPKKRRIMKKLENLMIY